MSTAPVDMTKMSAAEIRAFIESQNAGTPTDEQPRDPATGQFIAVEESAPPVNETTEGQTEVEPVVVEREIDLGDGSGIQVFRGVGPTEVEAYAALSDELVKAQTNATAKIRELSRPPAAAKATATRTPEEEFLFQQQLLDRPTETLDQFMEKKFAERDAKAKAEKEAAAAREAEEGRVADAFIAANPDYAAIPQNGRRIERELRLAGLPATVENLQKVYNDLKADGLIMQKAVEPTQVVRPRSSGLSTRTSVIPPPPARVDVSKLTTEQLRELSGGYQNPYAR